MTITLVWGWWMAVVAGFLLLVCVPPLRKFLFQKPWFTKLKVHLFTMFGQPYFKVFIFEAGTPGSVAIDAHYNVHFLYALDRVYAAAGASHYNQELDPQAKIAIYLYDSFGQIAENYMPAPNLDELTDELGDNIPNMKLNGGEEVRQVVDIATPSGPQSHLDVEMG